MTTDHHKSAIAWVPAIAGTSLWVAATALLLEDALHAQRFDVATMATPILTAATVAAACLAHLRFASWRLIGGLGFLLLALLGSLVMATGTLGRLAEAKDGKEAGIQATNRTYGHKNEDLKVAKAEQLRECKSIGPKCQLWNARVDTLTKELAGIVVRSSDPKADAIARLATLLGGNGEQTKEIVQAFDPVTLPLFLELGSVLFFASAFPTRHRKPAESVTVSQPLAESVKQPLTRDDALADFRSLKASNSQQFLAQRWHVTEGTVSRWLSSWDRDGKVERKRDGRMRSAAIVAPERKRLGHMVR